MSNMNNVVALPQVIQNKIIKANNFMLADEARNRYHIKVEERTKKEELFQPESWTQVIANGFKLRVGDIIEIIREDFCFFLTAMVMAVDKHGLTLKELSFVELEKEGEKEDSGLKIVWKGPTNKYAVMKGNGKELGKGFVTKAEAQKFLENNK